MRHRYMKPKDKLAFLEKELQFSRLPIGTALSCLSVRNAVRRIGKRMDEEATVKEDDANVEDFGRRPESVR